MFISYFVKAVYVHKDYNLDIEFNVSFDDFKYFSSDKNSHTVRIQKKNALKKFCKNSKTTSKPSEAGSRWKGRAMELRRKNTGSYETCIFEQSKISSDVVDLIGIEPTTLRMRTVRSPS